jgi:hypothetical protein
MSGSFVNFSGHKDITAWLGIRSLARGGRFDSHPLFLRMLFFFLPCPGEGSRPFFSGNPGCLAKIQLGCLFPQTAQADGPIQMLASFLLATDADPGGTVKQSNGAVGGVDMLPPLAAGTETLLVAFV